MAGAEDDTMKVREAKPDLSKSFLCEPKYWKFEFLKASDVLVEDTPDYNEKYKKYEADYVRWLKAKYFSKKNLYGGIIFDKEVTIEDEIIKSSRWPCTRSFTDPVLSFEDQGRFSASATENSTNHPNKKYKSSVDMVKVDQLHASLGVHYVKADPSVNSEVEASPGPEAETIVQPSSIKVHAEEQTMQLECPPIDVLSTEQAEAKQVGAPDVPSRSTSPPLSVEAAKSCMLIHTEEFEGLFEA